VTNKKYEALATFLKDQNNNDTLFVDTIDSHVSNSDHIIFDKETNTIFVWWQTILELLQNDGGNAEEVDHLALEDILDA